MDYEHLCGRLSDEGDCFGNSLMTEARDAIRRLVRERDEARELFGACKMAIINLLDDGDATDRAFATDIVSRTGSAH